MPKSCPKIGCRSKKWNSDKIHTGNNGHNLKDGIATITHGMSKTTEYQCWRNMKARCDNQNNKNYHNYGGRGITYCKRWEKFENFYEDMGSSYKNNLSIDRINNDGDYVLENCRYLEHSENSRLGSLVRWGKLEDWKKEEKKK